VGGLARAGVWVLLLAAAVASAQQVDVPVSEIARCVTVRPGAADAPVFPFEQYTGSQRGAVQVLLSFTAPDGPPAVTVQESHGGAAFVDAVRAHAKDLRVPCMPRGEGPARLIRDYIFRPEGDRRVQWHRTRDAAADEHRRALRCVSHVIGKEGPTYPYDANLSGMQGRVIAEMSFSAPDRPPEVRLHARRSARLLARAAEDWAAGLRMPCHPGGVIRGDWLFIFLIEGNGGYGFRDVPFRTLLASTVGIEKQRLQLDTQQMGCPFEVHFQYRQPHLRNRVGEVGESDPARRPLLEWMETIELKLPSLSLDSIYGDSTRITVPCVRIDLKPKE
jgi:hypothetical protein